MRTVSAILLTALICFNLFGFYATFFLEQAEIKGEVSESISQFRSPTAHEVFTFSNSAFAQLSFLDNGKELSINGKLYDVITIETTGNQTMVSVEYDVKETALVGALTDIINQQQDKAQNSSPLKTIISHFQQDYVNVGASAISCYHTLVAVFHISKQFYPSSSFVADNLTPPPQFFLV